MCNKVWNPPPPTDIGRLNASGHAIGSVSCSRNSFATRSTRVWKLSRHPHHYGHNSLFSFSDACSSLIRTSSHLFSSTSVPTVEKKIEKLTVDKSRKLPCTNSLRIDNQIDRDRCCRWPRSTRTELEPEKTTIVWEIAKTEFHCPNNWLVNHFGCYKWISKIRKCQLTIILVMTTMHFTRMHDWKVSCFVFSRGVRLPLWSTCLYTNSWRFRVYCTFVF